MCNLRQISAQSKACFLNLIMLPLVAKDKLTLNLAAFLVELCLVIT